MSVMGFKKKVWIGGVWVGVVSSIQFHFLNFFNKPLTAMFQNPLPLSLLTYKGDLNVSLRFVTPDNLQGRKKDGRCGSSGCLHVLIKQARNLTAVRANGSSDPFCKGYVPKLSSDHSFRTFS